MIEELDNILLSDTVVEDFKEWYSHPSFKNWLINLLPEVEDCKNLKQDNPWHIYNCLEHILHSVEHINKFTKDLDKEERKMLSYTMFLHDIGKPECHIRRYSKQYGKEVDSFFDHNVAGVRIADRVLGKFGFSDEKCSQIKALIMDHDMFMFLRLEDDGNRHHKVLSREIIDNQIKKFNSFGDGKTLMQYLIWVGMSDNMSQNPDMTKESLYLIGVMNTMLDDKQFSM